MSNVTQHENIVFAGLDVTIGDEICYATMCGESGIGTAVGFEQAAKVIVELDNGDKLKLRDSEIMRVLSRRG